MLGIMDAEEESEGVEENVLGEVGKLQDGLNQGRLSGPKVRHKTNQNPHRCELTLGSCLRLHLPSQSLPYPPHLSETGGAEKASIGHEPRSSEATEKPSLEETGSSLSANGPEPSITQHAIPAFGTSP